MIVVDASVAAKWIFPEEHSGRARRLLRAALDGQEPIFAPPLLPIEITNIIRQRMRREALSLALARELLIAFLTIPVILRAPETLYDHALALAERHSLPATYDAHYVALAELLGCMLWTDDQRLLHNLGRALPFVRPIADYGGS